MLTSTFASRLIQLCGVLIVVFGWILLTEVGEVSPILLPALTDVWLELYKVLISAEFIEPMFVTVKTCLLSFAISSTSGIAIGYLFTRSRKLMQVFEPLLSICATVPMILFYPVFVLYFGIGTESKVVFAVTVAFFPIVLAAIAGFGHIDPTYTQAAKSMGASAFQTIRFVLIPAAFPVVLSGMRMGATLTFLSVLGGETLASVAGLGFQIHESTMVMNSTEMYAYIFIVVSLAGLLNLMLGWIESYGNKCYGVTDHD